MILSDRDILSYMESGDIVIKPFNKERLGCNSYDICLGRNLLTYQLGTPEPILKGETGRGDWEDGELYVAKGPYGKVRMGADCILDAKKDNPTYLWPIPEEGVVLMPGTLYLGVTEEYTETHRHVPWIEGKSSVGRLGITIHVTAGRGDIGFRGHWTLEIVVAHPVRVYAGMPIGQLTYFTTLSQSNTTYDQKKSAKYIGEYSTDPRPVSSQYFKNFKSGVIPNIGEVWLNAEGNKFIIYSEADKDKAATLVADKAHADGDYSYMCKREWCKCHQ